MTALSVVRAAEGMRSTTCGYSFRMFSAKTWRMCVFAETPPPTTSVWAPVRSSARAVFFHSTSAVASSNSRARCCFSLSLRSGVSFKRYSTAVFNPANEKSQLASLIIGRGRRRAEESAPGPKSGSPVTDSSTCSARACSARREISGPPG